ncbi:thioesterase [Actinophytocola xanthii]|uniref:Thioesterase n=2 Tax=Actinophytocola xanthii TaxID=1912961 RepID=A0A1Q8CPJ4_9PSEU|nr:thioesterase [Actinophytocola xanthii]
MATARLVCFPHAGGAASFFHPMATAFAPSVDVVSLQYPGRQDRRRESCIDHLPTLADAVTAELEPCLADGLPTVFFGHSMGALLAFEVAWRLERRGTGPGTVIASGRRAPSTTREEQVHLGDDDALIEEIKRLNGTDAALLADEEILRMSLPAIRGDYTAVETYRGDPERRIGAAITVLTGDADPKTTADEARGWERHTTGAFRVVVLPGGHFFLVDHQPAVIREVTADLDRGRGQRSGRAG